MPYRTALTERLGLDHPIIQAPMAGGPTTVDLVTAAAEGGALGFFGCAYSAPEQILELAAAAKARTNRAFGINLFAPLPAPEMPKDPGPALARLAAFHADLGLPAPTAPAQPAPAGDLFARQIEAVMASGAKAFSVTFGLPSATQVEGLKERGIFTLGTATTVAEAIEVERRGFDAVIAQGSEAGGHRGTFAADISQAQIGGLALVPQVVDAVKIPVAASGGIMDGRGLAAVLALGASAAQIGTAFLTCDEAGTSECYRAALLAARGEETKVTRAFSGRLARGVLNRAMREVDADPAAILPFPLQNVLTRPMRTAAAKAERAEFLSLWAGQGVGLSRRLKAQDLIRRLGEEAKAAIARLGNM